MRIIRVMVASMFSLTLVGVLLGDAYKSVGNNYVGNALFGLLAVFFLIQVIYLSNFLFAAKYQGTVIKVIKIKKICNFKFGSKRYLFKRYFFIVKTSDHKELILSSVYVKDPDNSLILIEDFFKNKIKIFNWIVVLYRVLIVVIWVLFSVALTIVLKRI